MKKSTKTALGILGLATLALITRKYWMPLNGKIDITNIDWDKRVVSYDIYVQNTKIESRKVNYYDIEGRPTGKNVEINEFGKTVYLNEASDTNILGLTLTKSKLRIVSPSAGFLDTIIINFTNKGVLRVDKKGNKIPIKDRERN